MPLSSLSLSPTSISPRFPLRSVIAGLLGSACATGFAEPLDFVQFPPGSAYRSPTPNVIVSVDNSGSMMLGDVTTSSGSKTTRLSALQSTLRSVFNPAVVPDNAIRLAYQSMKYCNQFPNLGLASLPPACTRNGFHNGMKLLTGKADAKDISPRGAFYSWIGSLNSSGGTPSHTMMKNAGEYLRLTNANNPWNDIPGTAQAKGTQHGCRRTYHIFLTDGEWTDGYAITNFNNFDGMQRVLPDGTVYNPADTEGRNQLNFYRDGWGSPSRPTLSDLAFHYWSQDLQPDIPDKVTPSFSIQKEQTFPAVTLGGKTYPELTLQPYWNPQNNPATWQHMVNFTIGFGPDTAWTTSPAYSVTAGSFGGASYANLAVGAETWANPYTSYVAKRQELWHVALNSRGEFFLAANSVSELSRAFTSIFSKIFTDNVNAITSFAGDTSTLMHHGSSTYTSAYDADGWSGRIYSDTIAQGGDSTTHNAGWGTVTAGGMARNRTSADLLDARTEVTSRLILTHNGTSGVPFQWRSDDAYLSAEQKDTLGESSTANHFAQTLVNFIRGDRSAEAKNADSDGLRIRTSRQGDIINSQIWFVDKPVAGYTFDEYEAFSSRHAKRPPMLYVGGNDGMLHGFSADNGVEKIAYVPRGVYANLHRLAHKKYRHRYYVDGSPFTADLKTNSASWQTYLVGTLGAGGKGYFLLDVTDPSRFKESNASALVVLDATDTTEPDIGHIFGTPTMDEGNSQRALQITRTNDGRWALIMGNGYNSTHERPVLLIQYLDGNKELKKIAAVDLPASSTAAQPDNAVSNGLSTPQFLDVNADGIPDYVYAGDLKGNLWKFDIASADANQWKTAFNQTPLFTAVRDGVAQPITTAPVLRVNTSVSGLLVSFGTGRDLIEADRDDLAVQTVYTVMDYTRYALESGKATASAATATQPGVVASRAELKPQNIVKVDASTGKTTVASTSADYLAAQITGSGTSSARTFWAMDSADVNYCSAKPCAKDAYKGWYFDLPASRERVLEPLSFYDGSNVLEIISKVPGTAGDPDNVRDEGCERTEKLGQTYRTLINMVTGARPRVPLMDSNGDGQYSSADLHASRSTTAPRAQKFRVGNRQIRKGSDGVTDTYARIPQLQLRPGWRQLK